MGRTRRWMMLAVGALVAIALTGCGELDDLLAASGEEGAEEPAEVEPAADEDDAEVLLEAVGDAGPDPFTDPASPEPDEHLQAFAEFGAPEIEDPEEAAERSDPAEALIQQDGYLTIDAATPGLYGGTNEAGSCDPDQIADFLDEHPDRARAWADVHGIAPEDIRDFLDDTTPVNLGADTRVLNHGFADGAATPREAVLQRGTAVLVDRYGVPVVNCECGNPLLAPTIEPEETYTGASWENFREDVVLDIEPAPEELPAVEVTDYRDGSRFERPTGTRGEQDRPMRPMPDEASDEPADGPADEGCGIVVRHETGDEFTLDLGDGVDCDEAEPLADEYLNQHMGSGVDIGDWWCGPASAAGGQAGISASCYHDDGREFNVLFDQDDPPTHDGETPGSEDDEQAQPSPGDVDGEYCGTIAGDIGSLGDLGVSSDGFDLYVRAAEPCEIAEEVAEAFLLDFAEWMLSDDADLTALPYETTVLGWECSSGPMLGAQTDDFLGCFIHNGEFELTEPTG